MSRELVQVLHTITPADPHFIWDKDYEGILSFWIVALVRNSDEQEPWMDEFPIIASHSSSIYEQIQEDQRIVIHWSEMRRWIKDMGKHPWDYPELEKYLNHLWRDD